MTDANHTANISVNPWQRDLDVFKAQLVARGKVAREEFTHLRLLERQVEISESAPELVDGEALVHGHVASCTALARWLVTLPDMRQEDVAAYLNYRGGSTRSGSPWSQPSLSNALRDEGADHHVTA